MADDNDERSGDGASEASDPARDQSTPRAAQDGDAGLEPDLEALQQRSVRYSVVFQAPVYAGRFAFGPRSDGSGPATRKIADDELRAALQYFVGQDSVVAAADVLRHRRLVVLAGPAGIGRRCGALALLTRSAPPDIVGKGPIVELAPGTTTAVLNGCVFQPGTRYLITDYEPGEVTAEQLRFGLDQLQERLAEAGAVLVATSSADDMATHHLAVTWERVAGGTILDRHLHGHHRYDEATLSDLRNLADDCPPCEMPTFFSILKQAGPEAVTAHFDHKEQEALRNRVSKITEMCDLLPLVAALFLPGSVERSYEAHLDRLRELVDEHNCQSPWTRDYTESLTPSRSVRSTWVESSSHSRVPGRAVVLSGTVSPHLVLEELQRHHGREMWAPVHEWLRQRPDMISDINDEQSLATGMATYFRVEPVDARAVLDFWANNSSLTHRMAAAATVSALCAEQAEEAVRLAVGWSHGSPRLQVAAAMAFGQTLGSAFPLESISYLWRLCVGNVAVAKAARKQLVALVRTSPDDDGMRRLLSIVEWQLEQVLLPGASTESRIDQAIDTVISLLAAELTNGVFMTPHVLRRLPGEVSRLGILWAEVLRSWPHRADALDTLYAAYHELHPSDRDAPFIALGEVVRDRLSPAEWAWACRDLDIPLWTANRPAEGTTEAA